MRQVVTAPIYSLLILPTFHTLEPWLDNMHSFQQINQAVAYFPKVMFELNEACHAVSGLSMER